jgi:hypothetical protein
MNKCLRNKYLATLPILHRAEDNNNNPKVHYHEKMEASSTSETPVNFYQTTQSNTPEDSNLRSSSCSQEPATGPYPEPNESLQSSVPKTHINTIIPSTPTSSEWPRPFKLSNQNFGPISHPSHTFYMPRPSHHPWFDHRTNIWWRVQIMELLITRFFWSLPSLHPSQDRIFSEASCSQKPSNTQRNWMKTSDTDDVFSHYLFQKLLSFRVRSKTLKISKYKITVPVVLYGCETWSLALRE